MAGSKRTTMETIRRRPPPRLLLRHRGPRRRLPRKMRRPKNSYVINWTAFCYQVHDVTINEEQWTTSCSRVQDVAVSQEQWTAVRWLVQDATTNKETSFHCHIFQWTKFRKAPLTICPLCRWNRRSAKNHSFKRKSPRKRMSWICQSWILGYGMMMEMIRKKS